MQNFSHQDRLYDPEKNRPITVIGAGSVGSCVVYMLAKMGVTDITVYDGDSVESHNVPMSLYGPKDVATYKVFALASRVFADTNATLKAHPKMYEAEPLTNCSVISCVDTMEARKRIWEKVKNNPSVDLFIDTRTASAYVEVLSIDPNNRKDIARYEALWFPDEDATKQMCGRHGIIFSSMHTASIVTANLARYWTERKKEWRVAERCDTLTRAI